MMLDFIQSSLGIAIAWFCTVASAIYTGFAIMNSRKIKEQNKRLSSENETLKVEIEKATHEQKVGVVSQHGERNVQANKIDGGITFQ